jgi:hypothetical protein
MLSQREEARLVVLNKVLERELRVRGNSWIIRLIELEGCEHTEEHSSIEHYWESNEPLPVYGHLGSGELVVKPTQSGSVLLFSSLFGCSDQSLRVGMDMRRVYLRKNFHYESMIGTTFKGLGDYLDACCSMNATNDNGCPAWTQCREWWDNQCKVAYPDLPPTEIRTIIEKFKEAREEWLGGLPSVSPGPN